MSEVTPNRVKAVTGTINLFDRLFDTCLDIALLGTISPEEDEQLAGIVDSLKVLHDRIGARLFLELVKEAGNIDDPIRKSIIMKLLTDTLTSLTGDGEPPQPLVDALFAIVAPASESSN